MSCRVAGSLSPGGIADEKLPFRNEDDLTVKLTEIIFMNAVIKTGLAKGVTSQALMVRSHSLSDLLPREIPS